MSFLLRVSRVLTLTLLFCVLIVGLPIAGGAKAEAALPVCDTTTPGADRSSGDFIYTPRTAWVQRDCTMKSRYKWSTVPNACYQNTPRCNPVLTLQWALKTCYGAAYRYYGNTEISADGDFGPATAKMLAFAQGYENRGKINKVAVDGVFGPRTQETLMWPVYRQGNQQWEDTVYQGRCSSS